MDAEANCKSAANAGGQVQECLASHRTLVSWECQEQLFRQETENAQDLRLSLRLFHACLNDKKKVGSRAACVVLVPCPVRMSAWLLFGLSTVLSPGAEYAALMEYFWGGRLVKVIEYMLMIGHDMSCWLCSCEPSIPAHRCLVQCPSVTAPLQKWFASRRIMCTLESVAE